MEIRKSTIDDLENLTTFYNTVVLYLINHQNYPKWEYRIYPSKDTIKESILIQEQYMCVEENKIVGAFILNDNPQGVYEHGEWQLNLKQGDYLVIHTLAVDPNRYGQKIGQKMVNYCIEYAKLNGYQSIRLDVVPNNIPAIKLYKKMDFQYAGTKDLERNINNIPLFDLYELKI